MTKKQLELEQANTLATNQTLELRPNLADVLDELSNTYKRYVILPDGAGDALALWTLYSHAFDTFRISPILVISSPEKRCGKTTLMSIIQQLVANPISTSHITPAAIFRIIEQKHPTLIIDEGDAFIKNNEDMRGILNSGHTRNMACVYRTTGDQYEAKAFSTWAPKVIALIGKLQSTLMDRAIVVRMRRKLSDESVERYRLDKAEEIFSGLKEKCEIWSAENADLLLEIDPLVPDWLNDRAADNWRPLLAIAELAGENWLKRAHTSIAVAEDVASDDDSVGNSLLIDIRQIFIDSGADRLPTIGQGDDALLDKLLDMGERPWPTYNHGKPLSERQLADKLKPFDIKPKSIRLSKKRFTGTETAKGYMLKDFEDAFVRYLPEIQNVNQEPEEYVEPLPCYEWNGDIDII